MSITTDRPVAGEALLGRVRALLSGIRERAGAGEDNRAIPAESAQEFLDAGLARILLPREFGGYELSLHTWIDVVLEIAAADAAHGWCASLIIHHPHYLAQFPMAAQAAVWAEGPDVPMAAALNPTSTVEPAEGGYLVSGKSPFASGVNHCTWVMVGGMVPATEGSPEWTMFLIPPGQYEVVDTWNTVAMRGTGSNTVAFTDVFVPHEYTLRVADMREATGPGGQKHAAPMYRSPWITYAPLTFVAPMLGAALGALESYRKWNAERASLFGSKIAHFTSIQVRLARAASDLDAAELLLRRAIDVAELPTPATLELRARNHRDACRAAELVVSAIDTIMTMSGAGGFAATNSIQRAWRDIHFAASHVILNPEVSFSAWGRAQLGLDRDPAQEMY